MIEINEVEVFVAIVKNIFAYDDYREVADQLYAQMMGWA